MENKTPLLAQFYKKLKLVLYIFIVVLTIIIFASFMLQNRQKIDIHFLNYQFSNLSVYFICILFFIVGNLTGFFYASLIALKNLFVTKKKIP